MILKTSASPNFENIVKSLYLRGAHFTLPDRNRNKDGTWDITSEGKVALNWQKHGRPSVARVLGHLHRGFKVGIVPGSVGCIAIDHDEGPPIETAERLEGHHLLGHFVPSRTAGRGHFWLKAEGNIPQYQWRTKHSAGDTRHSDGYVVCWDIEAVFNAVTALDGTPAIDEALCKIVFPPARARRKGLGDGTGKKRRDRKQGEIHRGRHTKLYLAVKRATEQGQAIQPAIDEALQSGLVWDDEFQRQIDRGKQHARRVEKIEVEALPLLRFDETDISHGERVALHLLLKPRSVYLLFLLVRDLKAGHISSPFTVQDVREGMRWPGGKSWSGNAIRRHLDDAFYLQDAGREGKAKLYEFQTARKIRAYLPDAIEEALHWQTIDNFNKGRLDDNDSKSLLPENPRADINGYAQAKVKYQIECRLKYARQLLSDGWHTPANLDSLDEFITDWILTNEPSAKKTDAGLYHFEREQQTGLEIDTIKHYLGKSHKGFAEIKHQARRVAIERDNRTVLQCKKAAVIACKQQDKRIMAVKFVDIGPGVYIFEPVSPRQVVDKEAPPRDEQPHLLRETDDSESKDEEKQDITIPSPIPEGAKLPVFPRFSLDLSSDQWRARDLWQKIIEGVHAGDYKLCKFGRFGRALKDKHGNFLAVDAENADFSAIADDHSGNSGVCPPIQAGNTIRIHDPTAYKAGSDPEIEEIPI